MADENTEAEGGKKSSKKLFIIIGIVVILAVGVSVGVTMFLLGDSDSSPAADEDVAPPKGPAQYYALLPPLIITFNVSNRQRFLQASMTLMTRQSEVIDAVELHSPLIRNRLLNLYGTKDFTQLQTHEGKVTAQQESVALLNEILAELDVKGEVENVLFTNLVMQ